MTHGPVFRKFPKDPEGIAVMEAKVVRLYTDDRLTVNQIRERLKIGDTRIKKILTKNNVPIDRKPRW